MKFRAECLKCKSKFDLEVPESKANENAENFFKNNPKILVCKDCCEDEKN